MGKSFTAQVGEWAAQTEKRLEAVFRDSAQTVANEMRKPKGGGGNMPVKTGNLRRSLLASTASMPGIRPGVTNFPDNDTQINLVIAGATLGQTIHLGFQAEYARRMEYGFTGKDALGRTYNQAGNGFVRLTAQRWQQIVEQSAKTVQSRVMSRSGT